MTTSKYRYSELAARCDRYSAMVRARAEKACREAGIGEIHMCVIHNALLSYEQGKPWREVNYSALRRAAWLLNERRDLARRALDSLYRRLGPQAFDWR